MSDLVEFLTARLDEDEQTARIAAEGKPGHWRVPSDHPHLVEEYPNPCEHGRHNHCHVDSCVVYQEDAPALPHIARWDPARVLAEVEAKRRIIVLAADMLDEEWHTGYTCGAENGYAAVLELLALPYADHPDYRPEWGSTDASVAL